MRIDGTASDTHGVRTGLRQVSFQNWVCTVNGERLFLDGAWVPRPPLDLATAGDDLAFVFGTRGADGQPQTQFQVAANIIDFRMNAQEAVEAPRWCMGGPTPETPADLLHLESRFTPEVFSGLEERGYKVKKVPAVDDMMGTAACIALDRERGYYIGGADPRGDGAAIGH